MRHASLFTGIGGFDLAASWMGWENVFQCEIDPFCTKVLEHHFPTTKRYGDIRSINGHEWKGEIDILTGGFPCQPFSAAGQRRGTDDNRFLWPEMLRVIQEIQPTWIVAENVRGITSIEQGMVFERVCAEMEENGYGIQPLCIPACSVGAPHKRERIWFVAHSDFGRLRRHEREGAEKGAASCSSSSCTRTNTISKGLEGGDKTRDNTEEIRPGEEGAHGDIGHIHCLPWKEGWFEAATRLCSVDDGLPGELDGITVSKWRTESLKAYGNAIVPQVAYQIFQAISTS